MMIEKDDHDDDMRALSRMEFFEDTEICCCCYFIIINMTKDGDDYENDDDEVSNKTYRASLAPQTSVN